MASSTVPIEMCDQVSSATINSATRLKKKLTSAKQHFSSGKDVFGNIDLAQQRAVLQHALHGHGRALAEEVEHQLADDKEQRKVLDALTALVEQRTEHGHMTRQVSSGFSTLHATPSTLRRYFSLKSREMRFCSR